MNYNELVRAITESNNKHHWRNPPTDDYLAEADYHCIINDAYRTYLFALQPRAAAEHLVALSVDLLADVILLGVEPYLSERLSRLYVAREPKDFQDMAIFLHEAISLFYQSNMKSLMLRYVLDAVETYCEVCDLNFTDMVHHRLDDLEEEVF